MHPHEHEHEHDSREGEGGHSHSHSHSHSSSQGPTSVSPLDGAVGDMVLARLVAPCPSGCHDHDFDRIRCYRVGSAGFKTSVSCEGAGAGPAAPSLASACVESPSSEAVSLDWSTVKTASAWAAGSLDSCRRVVASSSFGIAGAGCTSRLPSESECVEAGLSSCAFLFFATQRRQRHNARHAAMPKTTAPLSSTKSSQGVSLQYPVPRTNSKG